MTRRLVVLVLVVACAIVGVAVLAGRGEPPQLLRDVYMPGFATAPPPAPLGATLEELRHEATSGPGRDLIRRLLPGQSAALWIMLVVSAVVALESPSSRRGRNVDLALMFAFALMFFDVMRFARIPLTPFSWRLLDLVFTTIVAIGVVVIVRAVRRAGSWPSREGWRPNVSRRALAAIAVLLLATDVCVALARDPDDAGYFTNLGAQRLRERGRLPYGDPMLTGTPGAAYGPVLYAAHIPFQLLMQPQSPNQKATSHPPLGEVSSYVLPPMLATKLCVITFHLAGVLALFLIGRRLTGDDGVGWALLALYCGSAFVLGIGGEGEQIAGITFISHIAPAATTLIAFAFLGRPAIAGTMLAVATGVGFYPAFLFPAWAAYYWPDRPRCVRFVAGFVLAAAVIGGATLSLSRPAAGRGLIGTIVSDTVGHHTDPNGYGRSAFGFWGQREGVRRWLSTPLIGDSGLTSPAYGIFFLLVATCTAVARRASAAQLALLTGAIAMAASLIKVHSTGSYAAWSYPFLVIGIYADSVARPGVFSPVDQDMDVPR